MTTNTVRLPSSPDLMGYCSTPWISDYTYVGAMDWRASNPAPDVASATLGRTQDVTPRQALLVWGRVERGQLVLEPAFSIVARPVVPTETGPYRVDGIARNGRTLFSYAFAGERPADANDATARQFAFAIPMDESTQSELATIRLSGGGATEATLQASLLPNGVTAAINSIDATSTSASSVSVRWNGQAGRMALIRDARTGQVLSFARGNAAQLRVSSGDLEITVSDGVHSATRRVVVTRR
jgi:hypothetical protein